MIEEKIRAQASTLVALAELVAVDPAAVKSLEGLAEAISFATDAAGIRLIESRAAAAYWGAWSGLPVRFARRDEARIPAHWRTFGTRTSLLSGSPRLATNPANALLNYLYAVLESEATIAARTVGLDPGLGVIHADQLNRDSLSADLMEPVRPAVDRFVLELLARRTFAARDFFETREGVCRLTSPLAAELAATGSRWRILVGRVAEEVARTLSDGSEKVPTPISARRGASGRGGRVLPRARFVPTCVQCGARTGRDRLTCSGECERAQRKEAEPALIAVGRRNLARLHAQGWRPTLTDSGRERLRWRTSELIGAARAWQRTHPWPSDMGAFAREVAPALEDVPLDRLVTATGLSRSYLRQVVRGELVPHPMWWAALRDAGVATPASGV